jgi:hypothetical protein
MSNPIRKPLYLVLLLVLYFFISVWAYRSALNIDFIGDDMRIVTGVGTFERGLTETVQNILPDRPLLMTTVWANYKLSGLNPRAFKITNLAMHALAAVMVFLLALWVQAKTEAEVREGPKAYFLPLTASFLYLLHPVHNQSINIMIQRGTILASLLFFVSLYFFILQMEQKKKHWILLSLAVYLLSLLCKGTPIIMPFVILLFLWCFKEKLSKRYFFTFVLISLLPLYYYFVLKVNQQNPLGSGWNYLGIQMKSIAIYLRLFFAPVNLHYLYDISPKLDMVNYLLGFLHLGLIALGVWCRKLWPMLSFLLLGFYISLIPENSLFPIHHVFFEHRTYLPYVWLFLILVFLVVKAPRRTLVTTALLGAVPFYVIQIDKRNREIETPFKWVENTLSYNMNDHDYNLRVLNDYRIAKEFERSLYYAHEFEKLHPQLIDYVLLRKALEYHIVKTEKEKTDILAFLAGILRKPAEHGLHYLVRLNLNTFILGEIPKYLKPPELELSIEKLIYPQAPEFLRGLDYASFVLNQYSASLAGITTHFDSKDLKGYLSEEEASIYLRAMASARVYFSHSDPREQELISKYQKIYPESEKIRVVMEWSERASKQDQSHKN